MEFKDPHSAGLHELFMQAPEQDGKVQIDAVPVAQLEEIAAKHAVSSLQPDYNAQSFYITHFEPPVLPGEGVRAKKDQTMEDHISSMWTVLARHTPEDSYTGIGLPNETIVPGERFGESYYWDSYFTMLGLAAEGK